MDLFSLQAQGKRPDGIIWMAEVRNMQLAIIKIVMVPNPLITDVLA